MVLFFKRKINKSKLVTRIQWEIVRKFNIECSVHLDEEGVIEVYMENQPPRVEEAVELFIDQYRDNNVYVYVNNDIEDLLDEKICGYTSRGNNYSRLDLEKMAYNRYLVDGDDWV